MWDAIGAVPVASAAEFIPGGVGSIDAVLRIDEEKIVVVHARPFDPIAGQEIDLFLSNQPYMSFPGDTPASTRFEAILEQAYEFSASLFQGDEIGSGSVPTVGDGVINNSDDQYDYFARLHWEGRQWHVFVGEDDTKQFSSFILVWPGKSGSPKLERDRMVIELEDIGERFSEPIQDDQYEPGFEPYWVGDGVRDQIAFGDVLDRGILTFSFGAALRSTAALSSTQGVYGKKNGAGTAAGYALAATPAGDIFFVIADGDESDSITAAAPTGTGDYNTGERIALVGEVNRAGSTLRLHAKVGSGAWSQIGTATIAATMGSLNNTDSLYVGRLTNVGTFFAGEIQRVCMQSGAGSAALNTADCKAALDERYADDFDAANPPSGNGLDHYVPLTENFGNTAGDLGPNGFDGTILGGATWAASTAYSLGAFVIPTSPTNTLRFEATTAGTSGSTEPTWPTLVGQTVVDGTVTWTARAAKWSGTRNGHKGIEGQARPLAFGAVQVAEPAVLDQIKNVLHLHVRNIDDVLLVEDGGVEITEDTAFAGDFWTDEVGPAAGEYVWMNDSVVGAVLRLGSPPAGRLTVTFRGDAVPSYTDRPEEILKRLAVLKLGATDPDDFDEIPFNSFDGSRGVQFWHGPQDNWTRRAAFDELMESAHGWWAIARTGIYTVGQIEVAPTQTDTIKQDDVVGGSMKRVAVLHPHWRDRVGYQRIWAVQGGGEVFASVGLERRNFLTQEYRFVSDEVGGALIKTEYLDAIEATLETLIVSRAHALLELADRRALFTRNLEVWQWRMPTGVLAYWLGRAPVLEYDRYELDGKVAYVLGLKETVEKGLELTALIEREGTPK